MRKVVIGLVVVLIVGVGGYFGLDYWAQGAAARGVDGVLHSLSPGGGTATHGRIELSLWQRTLKVSDILVKSQETPSENRVRVAQVVASDIDTSGRAGRIEIDDLELTDDVPGYAGARMVQKIPRIILTGFKTTRPISARKAASALDAMRLRLEQFSAITAQSIEIPSLTVTTTPPTGPLGQPAPVTYTYHNLVLRDVHEGKVAEATADRVELSGGGFGPGPAPIGEIKGEIGKVSVLDADMAPVLAFLDPSRPRGEEGYQRVYRRMAMGPYTLNMGVAGSLRVEGIVAEDIGLHPGKLSLADITFLTEIAPAPGVPPSPAQLTMLMDKVAGLYQGIRVGRAEVQGFSMKMLSDDARMASLRIEGLENGRLSELAIEGLSGRPAVGEPFELGRVALKGFDISRLLRVVSTQLSTPQPPGQPPGLDQIGAVLGLLEGIEIENVAVPDPKTRRIVRLDAFKASWGQPVGAFPSQARISLKMSVPIKAPDPEPAINMLADAGMSALAIGMDAGAGWSETGQTLSLEPASLQIDGLIAISAKASVGNVTREVFSGDPTRAMGSVALASAGPIEISLHDLGLVDLFAKEMARQGGAGPEAGRAMMLDAFAKNTDPLVQANPEAQPLFQAIAELVKGKGQTLTVRLTPKGNVGLLQWIDAAKVNPVGALVTNFSVEARTGG
jgi:hypothetical protein